MPVAEEVTAMAKATRRYSAKLKFQVVLEALRGEKTPAQIAKAYGVHANSVGIWKQQFLERGSLLFEDRLRGGENVSKKRGAPPLHGAGECWFSLTSTAPSLTMMLRSDLPLRYCTNASAHALPSTNSSRSGQPRWSATLLGTSREKSPTRGNVETE
jgi:hypothetical protein